MNRRKRSNVASYSGVYTEIRKIFGGLEEAKRKGLSPKHNNILKLTVFCIPNIIPPVSKKLRRIIKKVTHSMRLRFLTLNG
jgi:hypothetical protein